MNLLIKNLVFTNLLFILSFYLGKQKILCNMIFSVTADSKAIDNIQYILKTWKEWMKKQEHNWKVENNIHHSSTLFLKLRK